jgi:hypothetical protein
VKDATYSQKFAAETSKALQNTTAHTCPSPSITFATNALEMSIPQSLLDKVRAGSRCVICGGVNGFSADRDDRRCAACEAITDEDVKFLMNKAEKLRDTLVEFVRRGRRRIPTVATLSDSEKKRLGTCLLLKGRCSQTAVWMPATLKQELHEGMIYPYICRGSICLGTNNIL